MDRGDKIIKVVIISIIILFMLAVATVIGLNIYVFITYGNKPIDEIPTWALSFLFNR